MMRATFLLLLSLLSGLLLASLRSRFRFSGSSNALPVRSLSSGRRCVSSHPMCSLLHALPFSFSVNEPGTGLVLWEVFHHLGGVTCSGIFVPMCAELGAHVRV